MKEHLENIAQIVTDFVEEKKFSKINIKIGGCVTARNHTRLKIETMSCPTFESLSVKEVRMLGKELHDKIRVYLEENDVKKSITVNTTSESEFGYTSGVSVKYTEVFRKSW